MRLAVLLCLPGLSAWIAGAADLGSPASAETCGRCHRAIHEAWKQSSHAHAMESRLFQDALEMAESELGPAVRRTCLGCHAPVAVLIKDDSLRYKVSWEGITCDYCHSVRDVSTGGANPKAVVEFSLVKSGPLKDSDSTAHGTQFSSVHTSSLACAPCHEYRNALGFPVLTTYSEWSKTSYARESKPCQTCHMAAAVGDVVEPRIQRSRHAKVNLHQMAGSHSLEQLTRTIKARMTTSRTGDQVRVNIELANVAAGHAVPTGSPMRQLVLELRVTPASGPSYREQRTYSRAVADQKGIELKREHVAFARAAKVLFDTRIQPGERRNEAFSFQVQPGVPATVRATLWYHYSPLAAAEKEKRITFVTLTRLVR